MIQKFLNCRKVHRDWTVTHPGVNTGARQRIKFWRGDKTPSDWIVMNVIHHLMHRFGFGDAPIISPAWKPKPQWNWTL